MVNTSQNDSFLQLQNPGITQTELFVQLVVFYFGFGVVACFGNFCIAGGIARNRKQRSRFHVIVAILAVARACLALQFALVAVFRLLRTFFLASPFQTRANCHLIHLFLYNASTVELCLLCLLVIDRILAIAASQTYSRWTYKQAKLVGITVTVTITLFKFAPFYFAGNFQEKVKCLNVNSAGSRRFNLYNQHLDLVLALFLLLLYACLMLILHRHLRRLKKRQYSSTDQSHSFFRKRTRLIPTLRNMVLVHCGFLLSSKIMLFLSGVVSTSQAARLVAYGGVMLMVDLVANVVILLTVNQDIQRSSLAFFRRESLCSSNVNVSWATKKKSELLPKLIEPELL